ncbi:peptidase, partial [bacterium]|nr:peptidase [bacterium]
MKSMNVILVLLLAAVVIAGCGSGAVKSKAATETVQAELDKFAPVTLSYDAALLDSAETAALKKIVAAAQYMDQIFLNQVYSQNEAIRAELKDGTPHAALFDVMVGPFNRLDEDAPFINKAEKPAGANFYPEDMTKEELLAFVEANPALKDTMEHVFTRIVRDDSSQLTAVAYSEAYKQWLEPAAQLLNEAAELTQNASLKTYLQSRAAAFSSNDYYQSDMDWMDLDSEIEVVIGPYEVYEDKMFNYKAAFEAFVTIV